MPVTLRKPVLDRHGQPVRAVTLREPTARQVLEVGNPWALAPYAVDRAGVIALLRDCLDGVDFDAFADMADFRDGLAIEAELRGFFAAPDLTASPPGPASPPAAPPTPTT